MYFGEMNCLQGTEWRTVGRRESYKRFIRAMLISGHSRNGEFMEYTRFEKARIIGARALQISLGAPVIMDIPETMIDPIKIAMLEYEKGLIPITVNREA